MKRLIALIYYSLGIVALRADLVMSLSADIQNSARGTELVFRGTLTNTSSSEKLYLNDIGANLNGPSATNLTFEPNSFFFNVPGILFPDESYTDSELFRVVVSGSARADVYGATITLRGGSNIQATDDLATAGFTILSPDISVALALTPATNDGGYLTISFVPGPTATGLSFIVEGSQDLTNWDANKAEVVSVPNPDPPNLQTYRYKTAIGQASVGFLRVRVATQAP